MSWDPAIAFMETLPPGGLQERGWVMRGDGLVLPPSAADLAAPKPLAIGLFSGAGGMDCGLACAGFHVVAGAEWWPVAAATYLCNLGSPETLVYVGETAGEDWTKRDRTALAPHMGELVRAGDLPILSSKLGDRSMGPGDGWISKQHAHTPDECIGGGILQEDTLAVAREKREGFHETYCLGGRDHDVDPCELFLLCDVHELTGDLILDLLGCTSDDISLVAGGPPCQGFSTANPNKSRHDGRNQLVFEFARLVCEIRPKGMMMENVPGIVNMVTPEGIPVLDALSLILENGGMGEYDALRRSLAANAGAGAIVKGTRRRPRPALADEEILDEDPQLALEVPA